MAADPALRALATACRAVRTASPDDAVAGVVPRYVACPATVEEASALLRAAAGHGLAVVARGAGTKLGWGAPPQRCDLLLGTELLDRVVEHAGGDLVARVQAGARLERLAGVLATAGQQLALDPPPATPGSPAAVWRGGGTAGEADGATTGGTVGGTLATGAAGPRRLRYGTPRDLVIGITIIRADGTVARSGGKVVKNVAGYDLGKLFAGSYGTLGLIVEAVFRLHPLPAAAVYVTLECPGPAAAHAAVAAAAASELAPSAVEINRPAAGEPVCVGVLLEGDPGGVGERARLLCAALGPGARTTAAAPGWWGWPPAHAAHAGDDSAGTLIRIAFWAAALTRVLGVIDAAAAGAGVSPAVGGSAAAGVVYAALGAGTDPSAAAAFVSALRAGLARGEGDVRPATAAGDGPPVLASAVVLQAPPRVRERVDLWGPVPSLALMRAVKDQFDPAHLMAPGRFAGGI